MSVATPDTYPGTPGTPLYAGLPIPTSGSQVSALSLVNTSGSVTQAANFVSPMFGQPFKQGEMPAGQYPVFQLSDGTPCPSTIWSPAYWPDNSMKFCGSMIRVPSSIAASGTLPIQVFNGGAAPSAGARTLSDLTAADLKLEVTGVTNLSGLWTFSLNDGITSNIEVVQIGSGPAGSIWRVFCDFKQSGAAHGQMVGWHYIAAMTDNAGGLLGLRYLGRAAQPYANISSPAPTSRVMTAVLKAGATVIRTLQGTNAGETVGANVFLDHYSSFFTCGTNGKWDFIQGGGSASADCTVRVVRNSKQIVRTRLVPSYDTDASFSAGSSANYTPNCRGHMQRYMPGTGERNDIGVLPTWYVQHLLVGSANDEQAARVNGLAAGGWRICARQSSTKNVIACVDIKSSYAGMGTIQPTWRHWPQAYEEGMVEGAVYNTLWGTETEPSHRPSGFYYPYLAFGEPQYLDMAMEMGCVVPLNQNQNTQALNTTLPITAPLGGGYGERSVSFASTTYKGAGALLQENVYRLAAWGTRDMAQAIALAPSTGVYAGPKEYLTDILVSCYTAANAYNNLMAPSWRDAGLWSFVSRGANDQNYESPWAFGYLTTATCHIAHAAPETGAASFRTHIAKFPAALYAAGWDVAAIAAYRMGQYKEDNTRVDQVSDLVFQIRDTTLTFNTGTSFGTVASGSNSGWNPTNGDVFMFSTVMSASKPFTAAIDNRRLFAVEVSGKNFKLALTAGGAAIAVTSAVSISNFMLRVANFGPRWSFEGYADDSAYVSNWYGAIRHLQACGEPVSAVRARQDTLLGYSGVSFTGNPKNALAFSYPA